MTESIAHDSQQLGIDSPYVVLFELDARPIGGDVYRFTPACYEFDMVGWQGETYTPFDVDAEGFDWTGKGTLPRPKLRIGNASLAISAAVIAFGDLLGAIVTRTRTLRKYLDGQPSADPTQHWPLDIYEIQQKTAHTKFFIEWQLASIMDAQGRKFPRRQILRDACTHIYRRWTGTAWDYTAATCPYTGTAYWNELNQPCSQSADKCSKHISGCRLRFRWPDALPTTAFPGVSRAKI